MKKITTYSDVSIRQFYENLVLKKDNQVRFEYEIRVDFEQVVPRTDDLNVFYSYRQFIMTQTQQIEILLYKGSSRTYDKYVFELNQIQQASKVDIDALIQKELEKYKKEQEFIHLTEKVKDYKAEIKELKEKVKELDSELKNTRSMKDMVQMISQSGILSKLSQNPSALPVPGINGVEQNAQTDRKPIVEPFTNEQFINTLYAMKDQLGIEDFESILGSFLKVVGEHPELIPSVRQFIEESITKNR